MPGNSNTLRVVKPFIARQYEGVARYDHDVEIQPGTYEGRYDHRMGRWSVPVDARRVDNGKPTTYFVRVESLPGVMNA